MLPVITLVCGMPFIRSRTSTLCAPMAHGREQAGDDAVPVAGILDRRAEQQHGGEDRQQRGFQRQHPRQRRAAAVAQSPISAAVMAAARTNATMAMSLPAMPKSWVTNSAPAMTKLPVTCAANRPNSARYV